MFVGMATPVGQWTSHVMMIELRRHSVSLLASTKECINVQLLCMCNLVYGLVLKLSDVNRETSSFCASLESNLEEET